jgi:hypothetical protein
MRRFFVLFVLLLVACGSPETAAPTKAVPATAAAVSSTDSCAAADLKTYRDSYNTIMDQWTMVAIQAGEAQSNNLKPSLDAMQTIADQLATLKPPVCAQQAQSESIEAMKMIITGYQNHMAQKDAGQMIPNGINILALARARINVLPSTLAPTATLPPIDTPVPSPTPVPTATPTSTPLPTATPLPRAGVTINKETPVFETATSTTPLKSLPKGTQLLVFEAQRNRIHIRAGDIDGWVQQSAVSIP